MNILKKIWLLPVHLYKILLSPLLGSNCRFSPTCSTYMVEAVEEWGILRGTWMGLKRIFRCHPWGGSGYDPVPQRHTKEA